MRKIIVKQKDIWNMLIEAHYRYLTRPNSSLFVRDIIEDIEKENDIKIPIEMLHKLDKRYQKFRNEETKKFKKIYEKVQSGIVTTLREEAEKLGITRCQVAGFKSQYCDWISIVKKIKG